MKFNSAAESEYEPRVDDLCYGVPELRIKNTREASIGQIVGRYNLVSGVAAATGDLRFDETGRCSGLENIPEACTQPFFRGFCLLATGSQVARLTWSLLYRGG